MLADLVQVLGARLRDGRQREGLSLQRVEQRSGGRCKAVVVGSYERGDRAVTVQKLAELARFYGVPMSLLVPPDDLGSDDGVAIPSCSTSIVSTCCLVEKPDRWPGTRGYRAPPPGARNIAEDPVHRH